MARLSRSFFFAAALALAVAPAPLVADETGGEAFAIDTAHSEARFSVTHLYLAHVSGSVPIVAGTVEVAHGSGLPSRIVATLDPKRVDTGNGDRDGDLQGSDWFDTAHYPTWTFASTSITVMPGIGAASGAFTVAGTLTVHGSAQPVTLAVTTAHASAQPVYHAVGHIDRHAFGMRKTPTDGLIGSDVEMTLDVTLRPAHPSLQGGTGGVDAPALRSRG